MKPPSRQRSPLLATVRAMASACAGSRNRGSGTSATRSGDAAGIEAGDLLPGVRRVGGKPVDMAAQMGHAIRCRPGQRGGRPTLNICHGPVSAILVHGVDRRQQSGLRRTAAFNGECLVQMGMGFHPAGERQGSRQSHRPEVGWSVGVSAAIRPSRKASPPAAAHRWPASASRRAAPGRESGAADPDKRRARGGNVIVSLLTDPKPEAGISPANSRA